MPEKIPSKKEQTKAIQLMVGKDRVIAQHICVCENVKYLFSDWELDVISISKGGYLFEYEVKVSRSDFKADAKKRKSKFYSAPDPLNPSRYHRNTPNSFYYVCPPDLIKVEELPPYAGLIYATADGLQFIKQAPYLHKEKHDSLRVLEKVARVYQERHFLGGCYMTYINKESAAAYKEREEINARAKQNREIQLNLTS